MLGSNIYMFPACTDPVDVGTHRSQRSERFISLKFQPGSGVLAIES